MTSIIDALPKTGHLEVDIKVTAEVNVSAYAAMQKINAFVLGEVSYMMHAGKPQLVVAERIVWRVPVVLSLAGHGDVGEVGAVDVDVETGQLHINPQSIEEMQNRAEGLAHAARSKTTE